MNLRRHLKSTLEQGALWSGIPRAMRWQHRGDVLVLAYHDIVPSGERPSGDLSLHLPQSQFAEQLDALARTHDVIPLEQALAGRATRRPVAVITFDDAYQGAVTAGVAELARRGLPATIFVATGYVGGGDFWWDALASDGGLSPDVRERALTELAGADAAIRAMAARESRAVATPPQYSRGASEGELAHAASERGISLASHTHSHPNLTRLAPDALREELVRPLAWLRERFAGVLPMLSYPYGLSSPAVESATAAAGYVAGFRITGGWLPRGARAPFALPRLDVSSGLSAAGFALRCAGVRMR
jgi:peptidoglycan/xylan/chitin deacetylase (PgdA/CDA1 family)